MILNLSLHKQLKPNHMNNKIRKNDLSQMEEIFSVANYKVSNLEITCAPYNYGEEVEFEVYAGSCVSPYYFYLPVAIFEKYLSRFLDENDVIHYIMDDLTVFQKQELKDLGDIYWYNELAPDKEKLEAARYILTNLFTDLF